MGCVKEELLKVLMYGQLSRSLKQVSLSHGRHLVKVHRTDISPKKNKLTNGRAVYLTCTITTPRFIDEIPSPVANIVEGENLLWFSDNVIKDIKGILVRTFDIKHSIVVSLLSL